MLQDAAPPELHGKCETRLTAEAGKQPIRPFFLDNTAERLLCQRFQINHISQELVRHDGGGIGIDQNRPDPFLPQHTAGLGTGVIKLSRLPDHNRPGTDHQNFLDAVISRHVFPPSISGSGQTGIPYHEALRRLPGGTVP